MFYISNPESINVAIISGGTSGERTISLASGKGVQKALLDEGYQVDMLDSANKSDLQKLLTGNYDVAFLCLHGKGGEDGSIQGFLETIGLPYTGPGVFANAACINKQSTKVFYDKFEIPTPASVYLQRGESFDVQQLLDTFGQKMVVKAATEGSSLGVYIVEGENELAEAIKKAFEIDSAVLIEQFVEGLELTVAVLGQGDECQVLPIIEIIPRAASYDYDSKYAPGGCQHICPARIPDDITQHVQDLALKAHKALQCHGISRTDFLLDKNQKAWALETNTIPGMTETSLVPDAAAAAGISFSDVCSRLIQSALEKAF